MKSTWERRINKSVNKGGKACKELNSYHFVERPQVQRNRYEIDDVIQKALQSSAMWLPEAVPK